MKLVSITFGTVPRLPGLRPSETGHIECDRPGDSLKNWKLSIRGPQIYFVSPQGWVRDMSVRVRDEKGPHTVYGPIPIGDVFLQWQASPEELEMLLKGGKYESPPFGWQPTPVAPDKPIIAQIPVGDMGDA